MDKYHMLLIYIIYENGYYEGAYKDRSLNILGGAGGQSFRARRRSPGDRRWLDRGREKEFLRPHRRRQGSDATGAAGVAKIPLCPA